MNPCYAPAIVFFLPFESPPVLFIFGCHGSSLPHGLFSSCGKRGLLMVVASCAAAHGLQGTWARQLWLRAQEHRLKRCGAASYLPHGMWDGPGSGLKPVSPALAGGFFNTESAGKPLMYCF